MSRIEELLEGICVEDILEREGADYKVTHGSRGEQLNVHECPFCGGDEWKVYINRDTGLGNCFHGSCGETFNIFKLVRAINGTDSSGAWRYLEDVAKEIGWRPKRSREFKRETQGPIDWQLPNNIPLPTKTGDTLKYLLKRGIDKQATAYFDLRYCHTGWYNYEKDDGTPGGMKFDERVLVPIYDLAGDMQTFQGRDLTGNADRKYLFPPGLPGTGRFLFNSHNVTGRRRVIVNEGAFDVIRSWINLREASRDMSDTGVVGSFGLDISGGTDGEDQVNQFVSLRHFGLEEIVIMWDGEEKAYKKAVTAAKRLLRKGFKVWIALPPKGMDPGEMSTAQFLETLDNALPANQRTMLRLGMQNPYAGNK